MIGDILSIIGNYNYCTQEEYAKAIEVVRTEVNARLDYMKANTDTDLNGKISVKETGKQLWGMAKTIYKTFRSNSKKYWS